MPGRTGALLNTVVMNAFIGPGMRLFANEGQNLFISIFFHIKQVLKSNIDSSLGIVILS